MQTLKVIKLQHSSRIYIPADVFAKFSGVEKGEYYSKAYLTLDCSEGMLTLFIDENGKGAPVTVHSKKVKAGWYLRYVTIPFAIYKVLGDRSLVIDSVDRGFMSLKVL